MLGITRPLEPDEQEEGLRFARQTLQGVIPHEPHPEAIAGRRRA